MYRTGQNGTPIDDLTYQYFGSSNRLMVVQENPITNSPGFEASPMPQDYFYDTYGNLTRDLNKGIGTSTTDGYRYNHLNQPIRLVKGTSNMQLFYNAAGQKVKKVVLQNGVTTTTDYLDGFQYKNTTLEFFGHAEGFVANSNNTLRYVFQYKDQVGNVRVSYAANTSGVATILEENHYYPYGLKHAGYGMTTTDQNAAYKYRYNSREFHDELGLDMTAMDFRMYDNILGRFFGMDALSENFSYISPYNFGNSNPIVFADPTGLAPEDRVLRNGRPNWMWDLALGINGQDFNPRDKGGHASYTEIPGVDWNNFSSIYSFFNSGRFRNNGDGSYTVTWWEQVVKGSGYYYNLGGTWQEEMEIAAVQSQSTIGRGDGGVISNSNPLTWVNTALGFASLNYGLRANFLRQNELWHYSKNGNLHHRFEKSWNKGKFKNVRTHQTRHLAKARGVSNGLAWVALGTTAINIHQTGQVKASDVLYGSMAAISFSGVGSIVAGVFFIADLGVMAHSYISSGGKQVKNTGDYLDDYFNGGVIYDHNN